MSKLKTIRENLNLTQEELSEKSGVSVRTIQRIETGIEPKGHTRKVLAKALKIEENELLAEVPEPINSETLNHNVNIKDEDKINYALLKLINLSSIPFSFLPPLNILVPLALMYGLKQKNVVIKQLISLQILWTVIAPFVFLLGIFLKLGNRFTIILILMIVLFNIFIILRNAIALDKSKSLHYKLNFSMI